MLLFSGFSNIDNKVSFILGLSSKIVAIKNCKENKNFFKLNSKPIKKANVTEIEVNFKRNIKDISPKKNKINLRFNEIKYKYNKKKSISSNNQNYLTKSFAKKKIYK